MKRTKEHKIQDKAESIFESFRPDDWVYRRQSKDYGIDYEIEVSENFEMTGKIFKVQLKGTTKVKFINNKFISFKLALKHLRYYLEQITIPVFFVLCDVNRDKLYWLDMQSNEPLKTHYKKKVKQKKGHLSLRIPVENTLPGTEGHLLEKYEEYYDRITNRPGSNSKRKVEIAISSLPTTGEIFLGREKELSELNEAWVDEQTAILGLVAFGGVGKTALVNGWLNDLQKGNYMGAERVYCWSFYNQGVDGGNQESADTFFDVSLRWFGDPNPGAGNSLDKSRRLARLVRERRTLIVLDGLEPLQYPPNQKHGKDGELKDQGLGIFLKELAGGLDGLCVYTSREKLADLSHKKNNSVKEISLEQLSEKTGMRLLKELNVKGPDKEIAEAVKEYDGHALSLRLLGGYLSVVYNGNIRQRDLISPLIGDGEQGGHARRIMRSYEDRLHDKPELDILYLMGLFDRPVEKKAVDLLRQAANVGNFLPKLQHIPAPTWKFALNHLHGLGLLVWKKKEEDYILDCHLLVREYFAERFKEKYPEGWRSAHKQLYHYHKGLPEKEYPDTLKEMEPLFAAVAHGCQAGLHEEVLQGIYWKRICRGKVGYIFALLEDLGLWLSLVSCFFEIPWSHPVSGLNPRNKASAFNWASYGLRAVGRLKESIQPMKKSMQGYIRIGDLISGCYLLSHFCYLIIASGRVHFLFVLNNDFRVPIPIRHREPLFYQ